MKIEDQLVSRELSEEMEELGFEQASLWYHILPCQSHGMIPWGEISNKERADSWNPEYIRSAYTVAELGEMLPKTIKARTIGDTRNQDIADQHGGVYYLYTMPCTDYCNCFYGKNNGQTRLHSISAETEANARAKMLIHLKKQGLL